MAKSKKSKSDPYAKREARKYANPIASREFILEVLEKQGKPLRFNLLAEQLKISPKNEEAVQALERRLKAMLRDGQVVQNRRLAYGLPEKMDLIKGRVSANAAGFGFLIPEDGGEDLFLSPGQMKALFDGDVILAKVSGVDRRGKKEGRVVEILERNTHEVVGRCFRESGITFLEADNKKISNDILIVESESFELSNQQFVVAEIIRQPDYRSPALAKVKEVLGEHMAPGMEIEVAIRSHQLPFQWSESLEKEVARIPLEISSGDIEARIDLRDKNFVTIDGEDARDFDDAVFCEPEGKGWKLYVAIADVSHYVKINTALDEEAFNRGNSVYFPQRVIPMLPEKLSNGLCSLNPAEDRLTMVCEIKLDQSGEALSYRFMEACIHSRARLTYTEVGDFIENGNVSDVLAGLTEEILHFYELFKKLKKIRDDRGAINVETTESRFIFNKDKKIEAVVPVVRNVAHLMIEEAMLLANTCAAKLLQGNNLPAVYRTHDVPGEEKLNDLKDYLQPLGFRFEAIKGQGAGISPAHFQQIIEFSEGRPDQELINTIVLRSMQQAIYNAECHPHFGLAYEQYTHFTSPIRRYPDLIVHRAIKFLVRSGKGGSSVVKVQGAVKLKKGEMLVSNESLLHEKAQYLSFTERRADLATRDAMDWLKCEFMLDKVGDVFTGKISSVTPFGFFVLLDEYFIEGLVHISDLKSDYYHYDERRHELQAEHSKEVFRLADEVKVQVANVSLDEKKIEFILEGEEHLKKFSPAKKSKSGNRRNIKSGSKANNRDKEKSKGKSGKKSHKKNSRDREITEAFSENFTKPPEKNKQGKKAGAKKSKVKNRKPSGKKPRKGK